MDSANEFGFERRPTQMEHFCRPASLFSPYGRIDDRIYVGTSTTLPATPLPAVEDAAPFNLAGVSREALQHPTSYGFGGSFFSGMNRRLDDWFKESCRIAGERGVNVSAIYVGYKTETVAINLLEQCVDAAGGKAGTQDVFVTPDAKTLKETFQQLFSVRRSLRFLN